MTRRFLVIAIASAAAAASLVPTVAAAGHRWWWQDPSLPAAGWRTHLKPSSGVPSVVGSGIDAKGKHWTAVAYEVSPTLIGKSSPKRIVCQTMIFGKISSSEIGGACGPMIGVSGESRTGTTGWILYASPNPSVVQGAVATGVARVVFVLRTGATYDVPGPFKSVGAVPGGIRFFAIPYAAAKIASVIAYGKDGKLLQEGGSLIG